MYPITKETHLENLANILREFKRKYAFNEAYLNIEGAVQRTSHSLLKVECMNEFDKFTFAEVKNIKRDIYKQLSMYLDKNDINDTLIIRNRFRRSWANEGQELVFETVVNV
jgi:hypothetical protein